MKRGFTLIELLIVIGMIAVLATSVVLILNPPEMIKQARDAQRINDLNNLVTAINLYVSDAENPQLTNPGGHNCNNATYIFGQVGGATAPSNYNFGSTRNTFVCYGDGSKAINGGGWIPINFSSMGNASPLTILPADPLQYIIGSDYVYRYACDNSAKTYELDACLESKKYESKMDTDGGDRPTTSPGLTNCDGNNGTVRWYEVGTNLSL